ncbi:hypothetical protein HanPSC8_Chr05g0192981 [Helianthus annuus]|nr:hypothetical protein HanPSC8_Chr05g0192981 [Helianthus annuus]
MDDKADDTTQKDTGKSPVAPLHPVYTVSNIQHKIRILDGKKVTYSQWVKLFQLNARGYKVLDHIDGTLPPSKDDPNHESWLEIDAIVLQWIYSTVSDDLLARFLDTDCTALEAWNNLKKLFLNNKGLRAAALERTFTNLTLKSMPSLQDYCERLRQLATQLADVDQPVSESRLIIQLVTGLTPEYDVVAAQLHKDLPPWEDAVNLLDAEERRQQARQTPVIAAAVQDSNPTPNQPPASTEAPYQHRSFENRGPNRSHNRRPNSNSWQTNNQTPNRPSYNRTSANSNHPNQSRSNYNRNPSWSPNKQPDYPPWWAAQPGPHYGWAPPPCPYPTQAGWASPWQPNSWQPSPEQTSSDRPNSNKSKHGSSRNAPQAHITDFDPLEPTDIGQAFQALVIDSNDPDWNMDTGASDHLTDDEGSQDWEAFEPSQQ